MNFLYPVAAALLTVVCWGMYGPVLHKGQHAMGAQVGDQFVTSRLRPFLCVGIAYFAIAVVVPLVLLNTTGEGGKWTFSGTIWSLGAGAAGAIGALGIILALASGGKPDWVMPLVFGCAPAVSVFCTRVLNRSTDPVSPWFLAGLILVSIGAVMIFAFGRSSKAVNHTAAVTSQQQVESPPSN